MRLAPLVVKVRMEEPLLGVVPLLRAPPAEWPSAASIAQAGAAVVKGAIVLPAP